MLKEPFRRIRNKHFRSWWLIRPSSSALEKYWITLVEWFAVSKTKTKTKGDSNWCNFTRNYVFPQIHIRHEPSRSALHRADFRTSCNVHLLFCYYLWKAPTWEKGFNSGAVVSIKIHHIYSPFFPLTAWKQCHYLLSHRAFICAGDTQHRSCCCFHLEPCGPEGGNSSPPRHFHSFKGNPKCHTPERRLSIKFS